MNFYGLPEFIAYSMLLCISYVLTRQKKEESLRFWSVGWTLIFIHAALFMLFVQAFPFDVFARGTLMLAGQAFILAAFYQESPTTSRSRLLWRMGVSGTLNLIFILASAVEANFQSRGWRESPFYILTGMGAASTIWLAAAERSGPAWRFRSSVALTVLAYALQAGCLYAYGIIMASQWLMCWTYFAVAYFFLTRSTKLTLGVLFTALSFVLWGLVFPIYSLLMIYAPGISSHIESEVWNLPKFLAAASMILALLEERVISATHLASHDELTGLPNRRFYTDRFEYAISDAARNHSKFGLLVIDLDKFKWVNDTLGHQAGDDLLKAISDRFRCALRRTDILARTGGDEFAVIVTGVLDLHDVESVGKALQGGLESPIVLRDGPYHAGASIGAAVYPDDGVNQASLQAVADERMYACKELHHGANGRPALSAPPRHLSAERG